MKKTILFFSLAFILFGSFLVAQEPYKLPPKDVMDIINAPLPPRLSVDPTKEFMLLAEYETMPSIEYMAQPLLRLAGMRITPMYNARQVTTFYTSIIVKRIKDGSTVEVNLPKDAKLSFPSWSYDGRWISFLRYVDAGVELWVADPETGKSTALTGPIINATLESGYTWLPDNRHLLVYTILINRPAPPEKPTTPKGPNIQETSGKVSKVRTYQDLMSTPHDEALFDYYATSQLMEINVASGESRKIGSPGIYRYGRPSPSGDYLLVYRIKKPYSYFIPYSSFPHTLEIWNREGKLVHLLADLPLADEVPIRGVSTGVRQIRWQPFKPATLLWVEALDEGDPKKEVPHRDRLMTLSAPFKDKPQEALKIQHRFDDIDWLKPKGSALLREEDWRRRWNTTYLVNVDDPNQTPKTIFDLSSQDSYKDPGNPVETKTISGETILDQDDDWIYFSGNGATPDGDRPFLDMLNVKTMQKKRLFQCGEQMYESFIDFGGKDRKKIITLSESTSEPPNYFLYDLKSKKRKSLTTYKIPSPKLVGITQQLIKYTRDDGIELSGKLYLPADYKTGDKLPVVIWAYPREYNDPGVAGQVRASLNRFPVLSYSSRSRTFGFQHQLFFLTQGYAVLDGAQMPIVGDPMTMNDTFIQQLVASAKAAIEKLDSMGIIDPKRAGIGGHSYGAFMTANLLAHSDLFAAGIARSGAFNRSLTPFGFQNERRTFWQAPETYFKVSPFMHAHKVNEPILLIHGEIDNNSGTFPIQSRRFYHALKGHGATARLGMLPHESHGYRAKESILHVLAEMISWFDKHVKNK